MGQQYLGEIRIVSFNFPPKGWAFCNGQLLSIQQNTALFSLLGTYYGGDGIRTFQLPNLQAAMPVDQGNQFVIGQTGGEANHTLVMGEMASHNHLAQAVAATGTSDSASGNTWAQDTTPIFADTTNTTMFPGALTPYGNGQPHNNLPPYLALSFVIALVGIYPSRN